MVFQDPFCNDRPGSAVLRREPRPAEREAVAQLVTATRFFSPQEIAIAVELVEERLHKGPASGYEFLFMEQHDKLLGYTCFGLIPCTRSSYDLYWIAVQPEQQGKGIGKTLIRYSESLIWQTGGQRIYVETSSRRQYQSTRAFYRACGYREEAFLEDFYAPGDGKAIYLKTHENSVLASQGYDARNP